MTLPPQIARELGTLYRSIVMKTNQLPLRNSRQQLHEGEFEYLLKKKGYMV